MNFRITTLFFGLLLTMLWVFGLMIAYKKSAGDPAFVMHDASLRSKDAKIDRVVIRKTDKAKDASDAEFFSLDEKWYLKEGQQQVRVEGFRIDNQIIKQIREAKHDENSEVSKDPSFYGMNAPQLVVTLSGKVKTEVKEWKLLVGKENADKTLVYVASADRPDKVHAVAKKDLDGLFLKNPNQLRSRRLFDFVETSVTGILVKKGDTPLKVKRNDDNTWSILEPALGHAGFESAEPEDKKKDPHKDMFKKPEPPPAAGGVKGLLGSIINVMVDDEDDFVPLGEPHANFGVETGKENVRIEIGSKEKDLVKETLLVGKEVDGKKGKKYYYARLDSDDGVVKVNATRLKPILDAVKDPGKLRSLDIAAFETKKVDAIVIKQGQQETKFFLESAKPEAGLPPEMIESVWQMVQGTEKKKDKASSAAVNTLLEQVLGRKAIVQFLDVPDAEREKKEVEWGMKPPVAEIFIYIGGIEKKKDDDKKDDERKDDKKEVKKEEKKKDADAFPGLKKDAKAVITIAVGKVDKDHVYLRRTLEDGTTKSWFTVKKEFAEKVLPAEGVTLAYLDTALPSFSADQAYALRLQRTTDKGTETVELERRQIDGKSYWYIKDKPGSAEAKLADSQTTDRVVGLLGQLSAVKWLKMLDEKEDLDKYGLKNPAVVATFMVKKHAVAGSSITVNKKNVTASPATGVVGLSILDFPMSLFAASFALAAHERDEGEAVTIEFGKENDTDKEKPTYARHSGSKMLFLVDTSRVKFVKEKDLRDRTFMMNAHALRIGSYLAMVGQDPTNMLNFASPEITGLVHQFEAGKVKEVRLDVRNGFELRSYHFERVAKKADSPKEPEKEKVKEAGKDKDTAKDKDKEKTKEPDKKAEPQWTWIDKSNIPEFQLDSDKVAQFIKDIAKLETNRFVGYTEGPRSEHKLGDKEVAIKLNLTFEDGKTATLKIGTSHLQHGHFANTSYWPKAVFFVPLQIVDPILRGPSYFGKERSAAE